MALLLILGYAAICVVIFKFLRVPVNQWTITSAVIGCVVIVGGLLAGMNYNHPFTTDGRIYFYTTAITPSVSGRVTEVGVKANEPIEPGSVLFKIDPRPYQYVVDQREAALAEAEQRVKQLKTSFDQATAGVEKAQAQQQLAQQNYDRQSQLLANKVGTQAALDTAARNIDAATQSVTEARAAAERARLASPPRSVASTRLLRVRRRRCKAPNSISPRPKSKRPLPDT